LKIPAERRGGVEFRCRGVDRAIGIRFSSRAIASAVYAEARDWGIFLFNTAKIYIRPDRTIDERKVGRFMGELWKITKNYFDTQEIWKDEWKLRSIGPGGTLFLEINDREAKDFSCTRWDGVDQHRKKHLAPRAGLKFITVLLRMANQLIKETEIAVNAVSVAGVLMVDSDDLLE